MNLVFLMDPLETVVMRKDTTFALMQGAQRRGHAIWFLPEGGLTLTGRGLRFAVRRVRTQPDEQAPFVQDGVAVLSQDEVAAVFIRTDPPFDEEYLMHTWLLDRLPSRIPVLNRPAGIRAANEKIWAMQFADWMPATMVSRQMGELRAFLADELDVIAKPTSGYGGQAVFHLRRGDTNTAVALEMLTGNGRREIILQRYVPAAQAGDKRILLLNGEILGAVLRVHGVGDHRNNFFCGGRPEAVEVTARDRQIVAAIAPALRDHGLYFVGIDIIGDYLIEINVTSPTCLQEMNRLYGQALEDRVIAFAEQLIASAGAPA